MYQTNEENYPMRLFDYIQQGGIIMYILLAINIIGFAIMLSKILIYGKEKKRTNEVYNRYYEC